MINLYAPGGDFCGAGTKAKSVWHVTEMRGQDHEEGMVVSGKTDGLTDFGNMQPEWANKVFPTIFSTRLTDFPQGNFSLYGHAI